MPSDSDLPWVLAGLVSAARSLGQFERAAQLLGAANGIALGAKRNSHDIANFDLSVAAVAGVRDRLGETAFAKAWAVGHAMTPAQVIAYALEGRPLEASAAGRADELETAPAVRPSRAEPLNARELEALRLVASGLSNREIPRTVVPDGEHGQVVSQGHLRQTPGRQPRPGGRPRPGAGRYRKNIKSSRSSLIGKPVRYGSTRRFLVPCQCHLEPLSLALPPLRDTTPKIEKRFTRRAQSTQTSSEEKNGEKHFRLFVARPGSWTLLANPASPRPTFGWRSLSINKTMERGIRVAVFSLSPFKSNGERGLGGEAG